MKIKTILLLLACIFLTFPLATAQQANIRGMIIDEKEKTPIEYATIALLKQDSTLITGTTSDQHGEFTIRQVAEGSYILSVSFMGYQKYCTPVQMKDTEYYSQIMLHPSSIFLNEVTVAPDPLSTKGIEYRSYHPKTR